MYEKDLLQNIMFWKSFLAAQRFILILFRPYINLCGAKKLFQYIMFCNRSFSYFLKLLVKQPSCYEYY